MKNILITGGTGLVGSKLITELQKKGYQISILSRTEQNIDGVKTYVWDIANRILPQVAIDQADTIIHLAGANVGSQRWSDERKKVIMNSRIDSGKLLYSKIRNSPTPPETFITASAVGYYGLETTEHIYNEAHPPATDFFGRIGAAWEQVLENTNALGLRSVAVRLGVVLAKGEGALPKMSLPLKFGFGTPIGSGKQYIPWIHIDDAVNIFVKIVEDQNMHGAYNAAAPEDVNNAAFMRTLCSIKNRLFLPLGVPNFFLKLALGEMANIVLKGSRVSSDKIVKAGFKFKYKDLKHALESLI